MATNNKDFIVKNGINVGSNASITGSLSAFNVGRNAFMNMLTESLKAEEAVVE